MSEPQQTPTPEQTPQAKRPGPPARNSSGMSAASEDDPGYESRSRSQSRRRRRQGQRQRQAQGKAQAGNAKAESMTAIQERPEQQEQQEQPQQPDKTEWLDKPATQDTTEVQPFDRIKPPGESMMGPVSYARMMRGEIPWVGPPPSQPYESTQGVDAKLPTADPMDQDGLKLRIELNLDIEIELKASIHGDLTLALL